MKTTAAMFIFQMAEVAIARQCSETFAAIAELRPAATTSASVDVRCHAFKRIAGGMRQMPVKCSISPSRSFGLPEVAGNIHTSRQSCYKAGKA